MDCTGNCQWLSSISGVTGECIAKPGIANNEYCALITRPDRCEDGSECQWVDQSWTLYQALEETKTSLGEKEATLNNNGFRKALSIVKRAREQTDLLKVKIKQEHQKNLLRLNVGTGVAEVAARIRSGIKKLNRTETKFNRFVWGDRRPAYLKNLYDEVDYLLDSLNHTHGLTSDIIQREDKREKRLHQTQKEGLGYTATQAAKAAAQANFLLNKINGDAAQAQFKLQKKVPLKSFADLNTTSDSTDPDYDQSNPMHKITRLLKEINASRDALTGDPYSWTEDGWYWAKVKDKEASDAVAQQIDLSRKFVNTTASDTYEELRNVLVSMEDDLSSKTRLGRVLKNNVSDARDQFKLISKDFLQALKLLDKTAVTRASTLSGAVRNLAQDLESRARSALGDKIAAGLDMSYADLQDAHTQATDDLLQLQSNTLGRKDTMDSGLNATDQDLLSALNDARTAKDGVENITKLAKKFIEKVMGIKTEMQYRIVTADKDMRQYIEDKANDITATIVANKLDTGATSIEKYTDDAMNWLESNYTEDKNAIRDLAKEHVESAEAMVGNIKSNMTVAGKFLNQLLAETQTNAERTQHTVAMLLPKTKQYLHHKATSVLAELYDLEGTLKKQMGEPLRWAAEIEASETPALALHAAELKEALGEQLRRSAASAADKIREGYQDVSAEDERVTAEAPKFTSAAQWAFDKVNASGDLMAQEAAVLEAKVANLETAAKDVSKKRYEEIRTLFWKHRDDMNAALKAREYEAARDVAQLRDQMESAGRLAEEKTRTTGQLLADKITTAAEDVKQVYGTKAKEAAEMAEESALRLRGGLGNAEERDQALAEKTRGASAAAARAAILESDNRAAQQVAVHERYEKLKALATHQAEDLDARTSTMMQEAMEHAKKEALRIAASAELTTAEKTKALEKVDGWLASELQQVEGRIAELDTRYQTVQDGVAAFQQDAAERFAGLSDLIDHESPALRVEAGDADAAQAQLTLAEVLQDSQAQADRLQSATRFALENIKSDRWTNETSDKVVEEVKSLGSIATLVNAEAGELTTRISDALTGHSRAVQTWAQKLGDFEQSATSAQVLVDKHLQDLHADVVKSEQQQRTWTSNYHALTGSLMDKLAGLLLKAVKNADGKLDAQRQQLVQHKERLERVMNSDEVKLLAKVQKADQTFDAILDKQAKATEWMQMYDELTGSWRKEVAAAFDDLSAGVEDEVQTMGTQESYLYKKLKNDAANELRVEGAHLAEGGANANGVIDHAAEASGAEVEQLRHLQDARGRSSKSTEEGLDASIVAGEASTSAKVRSSTETSRAMTKTLDDLDAEAAASKSLLGKAVDLQKQGVEKARREGASRLHKLALEAGSFLEEGASGSSAQVSTTAAVRLNAALHAEHARLERRAQEVEREAAKRILR